MKRVYVVSVSVSVSSKKQNASINMLRWEWIGVLSRVGDRW